MSTSQKAMQSLDPRRLTQKIPRKARPVSIPISEVEQSAFCQDDKLLEAKPLEEELKVNVRWQKIPNEYLRLTPQEAEQRIAKARAHLGNQLLILGHHYQRDEIIKFTDLRGDSLRLAQQASRMTDAQYIVFCGVHFMAETADILSAPQQRVILPNLDAGCSMADMASTDDVLDCLDDLATILGEEGVVPIAYMNSTAAIKAACGRNRGTVCTSANATSAFQWGFERADRILFLPDQHLGRNTGNTLGIPQDQMVVWNPFKPMGGLTPQDLAKARIILWQGHCSVHTRFRPDQIQQARDKYPDVNVVVHPECTQEVVQAADYIGSTEKIIAMVTKAPQGSKWAIGTEINLVNRLAKEHPDKFIFCLDPVVCPCSTMYRIHPAYLLWVLEAIGTGQTINHVTVDEETRQYAKIALDRMFRLT